MTRRIVKLFLPILVVLLSACAPAEGALPGAVATNPPENATDLGPVEAVALLTGDEQALNTPTGLAADTHGNVYVIDTLNHRIVTFDMNGNAVASWGSKGSEPGEFNFQYKEELNMDEQDEVVADIFITADEMIYVADVGNQRVQLLDMDGDYVREFPTVSPVDGEISQAFSIAVDGEGNIFTMDLQYYVTKYDNQGTFIARWGGYGSVDGKFSEVGMLDVDSAGNVYVASPYQQKIQKFDGNGALLATFTVPRLEGSAATYSTPSGLDLDESGNMYVTDYLSNRVVILDSSGNVVGEWGGQGRELGQMYGPAGIVVEGNTIYVSEVYNNRVQKFLLKD